MFNQSMQFNPDADKLYLLRQRVAGHNSLIVRIVIERDGKVRTNEKRKLMEITNEVAKKCDYPLLNGFELQIAEAVVQIIPMINEIIIA